MLQMILYVCLYGSTQDQKSLVEHGVFSIPRDRPKMSVDLCCQLNMPGFKQYFEKIPEIVR